MTNPNDSAMPSIGVAEGQEFFVDSNMRGLTKRETFAKDAPALPYWFDAGTYANEENTFFAWRTYYADRLIEELNKTEK